MADHVLEEIRRARERLLDLSARNRLLNFRPTRRTSIQIVDELPEEVWRLLFVEGKELSFLAREEGESSEQEAAATAAGAAPAIPVAPAAAAVSAVPIVPAALGAPPAPGAPLLAPGAPHAPGEPPAAPAAIGGAGGPAEQPAEADDDSLFELPDLKTAAANGQLPVRYKDLFLQRMA